MKTIYTTLFMLMIACSASSQIEKGTILVGTSSNLSLLSVKTGSSSDTYFNIGVNGGYFLIDNLVGGVNLGYTKIGGSDQTTLGLFGRYYIVGKYFLGAGYSNTKFGGNSSSVGSLIFEGGYAAFLTKNIAVEPTLVYTNYTGDVASNSSNFGLRVGFSLYFNRK